MSIIVCPLSQLRVQVSLHAPSRVISVLDPGDDFPDLGAEWEQRHLKLAFHDAHHEGFGITLASPGHIAELVAFLEEWNGDGTLLVHCRAGIGRSTATAFVAACVRQPGVPELDLARHLRAVAPLSRPNEKIVHLADVALGRGGRMSAAIAQTGRGLPWIDVMEGVPFELRPNDEG
jgi:predicted protein tyrosine phosphatase